MTEIAVPEQQASQDAETASAAAVLDGLDEQLIDRLVEQAALKCVYLAVMSLDPTGTGRKRWATRWKAALNAFEITFEGRLNPGRK